MRLWSLHPCYLDAKGLVALWRESLLARKVLQGKTNGYRYHPQLIRFRSHPRPLDAIDAYLTVILDEAVRRGYRFDGGKFIHKRLQHRIPITSGQLKYERSHLLRKLYKRERRSAIRLRAAKDFVAHPLFKIVHGKIAVWERIPV